jgi:hypothetical protein
MAWIEDSGREWIKEGRRSLFKRDPVLLAIGGILARIPLEVQLSTWCRITDPRLTGESG